VTVVERVLAPAKLTVSLRITGLRLDGYHLIDAEMVSLTLADVIDITNLPSPTRVIGRFAAGVPTDEHNLAVRALAFASRSGYLTIDKQIPAQGGLGGGSADAAAVLRWGGVTDLAVAARLGADVPFCLVGGRARVTGIGDVIEPLPFVHRTYTLVVPPLGVSTVDAFRRWDEMGGPVADGPNDLEPAVVDLVPAMAAWRDRIAQAAGVAPVLAGSGATWFLDGAHPRLGRALRDATVIVTSTERAPGE
jgi:4-diphosphocytidyl-2-C-methyl-D-erythritol kinase